MEPIVPSLLIAWSIRIAAWLFFGIIAAVATNVGIPNLAHTRYRPLFFAAIVLAGPLVLLLFFVPKSVVQEQAQKLRDWLDRQSNHPEQMKGNLWS